MTTPDICGDGRRARIGLVVPSVNTVMEPWAARVLPEGIAMHTARMYLPDRLTAEAIVEMDRGEGMQAVRQIASCRPAVVAYGCTASSIVQGVAYDAHLRAEIAAKAGVPATTAAHAIMQAAAALGVRRVAAVSPYTQAIDAAEHRYFAAAGLEVIGGACLGITDGFRLAEPTAEGLVALAREGWDERAEALVVTCLNTPSHLVIERLEAELGKPVITSTQATLWHALRLAGIDDRIAGAGRLLALH